MKYQLWITDEADQFSKFEFDSSKEAYLFYLDHYAAQEDFTYYKECCGMSLYDIADDKRIAAVFRNVFSPKHHLYCIVKNKAGTLVPTEIDKTDFESPI